MDTLTLDQIAAKIATAEKGLATATDGYDRNLLTQIRDEYRRYATERGKQEAKLAAAAEAAAPAAKAVAPAAGR